MGNILTIFLRVFPIIFFVLLEVFSFYIIGKNNDFYQSSFVNKSNTIVGGFYSKVESYQTFMSLRDVNKDLAAENALLKTQLYNINQQTAIKTDDSSESNKSKNLNQYDLIPAKVIDNKISNARNYIIINKGSADGVVKDMGVINDKGPIGLIVEVNEHYSCLMSFIHKDAIFSARIKSTEHVGQLKWAGGDIRIAKLEEIPRHIKLNTGDEIVTSGYSSYFPENIPIGRVMRQGKINSKNFANINVALYNDFANLKYVYIVKNNQQSEIQAISDTAKKLQSIAK